MNLGHRIPIIVSLSVAVCAAVAGPALADARSAAAASPTGSAGDAGAVTDPPAHTIDLRPALAPDGRFRGRAGLQGAVDVRDWELISDVSRGDTPRFERRATSPAPTGIPGSIRDRVLAIAVSGADLYIGGWFQDAGGNQWADFVARWDGTTWNNLGKDASGIDGALTGVVAAIAISGNNVYVGGGFQNAAGLARADAIARWNGSSWSAMGADDTGTEGALKTGSVAAIAIVGSNVYVGGNFTDAAGIDAADYLARWHGGHWSAVGSSGAPGSSAINRDVLALAVSGTDVYVGGMFRNAGGKPRADLMARWDGSTWTALGSDVTGSEGALGHPNSGDHVSAIGIDGDTIFVGGAFTLRDDQSIATLARWNGKRWSGVGNALGRSMEGYEPRVYSIVVTDAYVYVGGSFPSIGSAARSRNLGRWDGRHWTGLGANSTGGPALNGAVDAIGISSRGVIVGGAFTFAGHVDGADHLARFKSGKWFEVD